MRSALRGLLSTNLTASRRHYNFFFASTANRTGFCSSTTRFLTATAKPSVDPQQAND